MWGESAAKSLNRRVYGTVPADGKENLPVSGHLPRRAQSLLRAERALLHRGMVRHRCGGRGRIKQQRLVVAPPAREGYPAAVRRPARGRRFGTAVTPGRGGGGASS